MSHVLPLKSPNSAKVELMQIAMASLPPGQIANLLTKTQAAMELPATIAFAAQRRRADGVENTSARYRARNSAQAE